MMYSALEIAKYVINKCTIEGCPISNLQLQKILYYIQREYLREGQIAFDDPIEAWEFGPVVPNVYRIYCGFAGTPIEMQYSIYLDCDDSKIIDSIVEGKRQLKPWEMINDVHAPEKAWALTFKDGLGNHKVIDIQLIQTKG